MKILLAIDASKCSEEAVEALIQQFLPQETEVLILHAVESVNPMPISCGFGVPPMLEPDFTTISRQLRANGEALTARVARQLESAGFKTATRVQEGGPHELILKCTKEWSPDIILLGSHGKTGLDRFLLGSVSEAVARHAPCPVEIVRGTTA